MATKAYIPKLALNTDVILDAFQLIKHTGNQPLIIGSPQRVS